MTHRGSADIYTSLASFKAFRKLLLLLLQLLLLLLLLLPFMLTTAK